MTHMQVFGMGEVRSIASLSNRFLVNVTMATPQGHTQTQSLTIWRDLGAIVEKVVSKNHMIAYTGYLYQVWNAQTHSIQFSTITVTQLCPSRQEGDMEAWLAQQAHTYAQQWEKKRPPYLRVVPQGDGR